MPRLLTASTAIAALALSLTTIAASPSSAADATRRSQLVFGIDGSLMRSSTTAPGTAAAFRTYGDSLVSGITASSGDRLGFTLLSPGTHDNDVRTRAVVHDAYSGGQIRVLDDRTLHLPASGTIDPSGSVVSSPIVSTDGEMAVWSVTNFDLGSTALRYSYLPAGPVMTFESASTVTPVAASPWQVFGIDQDGTIVTITMSPEGAPMPVTGAPKVSALSLSPDGSQAAFVTGGDDQVLSVAPVTYAGGPAIGEPTVLTTTFASDDVPQFSHDGTRLYWAQDRSADPGSTRDDHDLYTMPVAGGEPQALTDTPAVDEVSPVETSLDSVSPAPLTLHPLRFRGTSVLVSWDNLQDDDRSTVRVTRTGGSLPTKTAFVPGIEYSDVGLQPNQTYTYAMQALDRSGNASTVVTQQVTTVAPGLTFPDPTSTRYYVSPSFRVYFPKGVTYSVSVHQVAGNEQDMWLDHATGDSHVFDQARPGGAYEFLMTTHDAFGNDSFPTLVGTAVVPYDQSAAHYIGAVVSQRLPDRYLGSATMLRAAGDSARLKFSGNRFQIIGERCPTCGIMDVYIDGHRVAGVDTHDTQRRPRTVLYTRLVGRGTHVLDVTARGTAGHSDIVLDGFGIRH
jgi:hypothetical protein